MLTWNVVVPLETRNNFSVIANQLDVVRYQIAAVWPIVR